MNVSVDETVLYTSSLYISKFDTLSTPCRIVFHASIKSSKNISFNDILYTGPKLKNNPISILINFRMFPIAVTSEIKKMYRQNNAIKEHRQYQRILWMFDQNSPISIYELNIVTFGVVFTFFKPWNYQSISFRWIVIISRFSSSNWTRYVYGQLY